MKELRIKVLERVIKHMIHGEVDRAHNLMEKLMTAVSSSIVNEFNYGGGEDPMFPARRELQRELEDDLEQDAVDNSPFDATGEMPADPAFPEGGEGGDESCTSEQIGQLIADLVAAGNVDDEKLAAIVDILVGQTDMEPSLEDPMGGEVPPPEDPESVPAGPGEFPAAGDDVVDDPSNSSFKM